MCFQTRKVRPKTTEEIDDAVAQLVREAEGIESTAWDEPMGEGKWSPAEIVVTLHKICHDMQLHACGAEPRFFQARDLPMLQRLDGSFTNW